MIALGALATVAISTSARATSITFDNLTDNGIGTPISNGYEGLNWTNFGVVNTTADLALFGQPDGFINGTVSAPNVAFNAFGLPASVSSSTPFVFQSAYFNAGWNNGLSITVNGLLNGVIKDTSTFTVNATGPAVLEIFDWTDINELDFSSTGGTSAGFDGSGTEFAMDDLIIGATATPEPPSLALALAGIALLGFCTVKRGKTLLSN